MPVEVPAGSSSQLAAAGDVSAAASVSAHPGTVSLDTVIITAELERRGSRPADYEAENRALTSLMQETTRAPTAILQKLVDVATSLCRAHSAGISLLEQRDGRPLFVWRALAGEWSRFLGETMPREHSPCGTVLDRNTAILMAHPHRHFPFPPELTPRIAEVLLIPFYIGDRAVGTLWVVAHDDSRHFDAEDERLLTNLGRFASTAYQVQMAQEREARASAHLADELAAAQRLHDISTRLFREGDVDTLYHQILDAASVLMRSDMASMQMLYPERGKLRLIASKGLAPSSAAFWRWVNADSGSACAEAQRLGRRVIVPDVEACEFIVGAPDLQAFRNSGIRAVQSTPLVSRSGRPLGMISTHWRDPHEPSARDLHLLDVLARQAADLIERAQAEAALRAKTEELRCVTETAAIGLTHCSRDWRYLSVNRAYAGVIGLPPEEIVGRPIVEVTGADGLARIRPYVERVLRGETVEYETEVPIRGRPCWLRVHYTPALDDSGAVVGWIASIMDITERKRTEDALTKSVREKEALYQLADRLHGAKSLADVYDAALHAIVTALQCDRASILLFDDAGVMRFVGWLGLSEPYRKAVEGHSPWSTDEKNPQPICIGDVDAADLDDALKRTIRAEGLGAAAFIPLVSHGRLIGKFMTYFNAPHAFAADELELSMTIARQLAFGIERRRAEELLRTNAKQLALITDTAPVFIAYCNAQARFKFVNKAYSERFGLRPADCIGKHIADVIGERGYASIRKHVEVVLRGEPVDFETGVIYPGIGERFVHCSYVPEFDVAGAVVGFVAAITDITERRRVEEALRHSKDRLKDADRRKDEFLATLAHELRNPLAPLLNGLQIMKLRAHDAGTIERLRSMMERQLGQMVRLIDDLLDVSRISRGKIELRKDRIELVRVMQQAVETNRPLIEAGGYDLALDLPREPVCVDADLARMAQIVGNLLNNACKFTPPRGRIQLSIRREDGQAVIRVRDNGIGIAAGQLARIFEMFTQVDTSLERSQSGLGIGLTLVKTLTEMHGGTVEARSAGPGQGSEFIVRLPVQAAVEAELRPAATASPASAAPNRILVVDDNVDSAESLAMLLALAGHETRVANDGMEALEAAADFRPDLILLDIGLPKLNGYDVARRLREQPWGQRIALVALTGWGKEDDRRKSKAAGFDSHMVKPVEHTDLIALLSELGQQRH